VSGCPTVSVIVPVRDRAAVIGACLDSILQADYPAERLEVIVVDNASSDDTSGVLQGYGTRIRALYEPKVGPAPARNKGLEAARGEVIAFTDSDCAVDRAWIREIVAPLADRTVGAVGGRICAFPEGNNLEHFGERIHDHAKAIQRVWPAYLITMNLAVRRDLLRELHGFDERLLRCEDVDLAYRIDQAGYRLAYAPDAVIYHRNRSTLPELLTEGYAHGFHAVGLDRLHSAYVREMSRRGSPDVREHTETTFSRTLGRNEELLYWFLFRSAKRVGRLIAHLDGLLR
jgi:cellulose synthase/poly-beta-1,6-N-acetylglucosamine synthase-like glycosyltransferase